MPTGTSWHKVGSGFEQVAVPIVFGSLKKGIRRSHKKLRSKEVLWYLRCCDSLVCDWIVDNCWTIAWKSGDKSVGSAFCITNLINCHCVLTLANAIVLNYGTIAAVTLRCTVGRIHAFTGGVSHLVFVAQVVNDLLAIWEPIFVRISSIGWSESTYTNTLAKGS